jgi:N-formylglutamate deformylase
VTRAPFDWVRGEGPVLATAIHAGHDLREETAALTALDEAARLTEEDPFTDRWTEVASTRVVFHRSRWEVDVNRPRERCVYLQPEDCWGLQPWSSQLPGAVLGRSVALYDAFYSELAVECRRLEREHGRFVVLDLHSYNHRRLGPDAPPAGNPEVNVGTASVPELWRPLVDRFIADVTGQGLDCRENVRFHGATLAAWVHATFPETGCCLAVDVKKFFMDEHTGVVDAAEEQRVHDALAAAIPGLLSTLSRG